MNPLNGVGRAVKQFAMVFGNRTRGWWSMFLGRTRYDYAREVGDGRGSSLMQACVLWICRTFPEAPVRVCTINAKGQNKPVDNHPLKLLLDTPNPYYPGELLWYATLADRTFTGNAYWLKVRSGVGRVVELWWVPSTMMEPKWPDDGSVFISHYDYTPGTTPIPVQTRDVVHFRHGLDPHNMRKGLSPLGSLLREIFTDDEAANYTASMLRNVGVPPLVVSPGPDAHPSWDELQETKQGIIDRTTGDRRGEPLVFDGPTDVKLLGFNPQQMDVKALRRIPEERVSAVIGIPAAVVGLGTGLENTKVGATMAEMREQAYESNIIPTQRLMAAELRTQLLTEFGDVRSLKLDFDLSKVRVLQVDQDALHSRAREDLNAGLIMLSRAQEMIGEEPDPNGDVYYLPGTITPTDPAELLAPPEPAPMLALPPGTPPAQPKVYSLPRKRKGYPQVSMAVVRLRTRLARRAEQDVAKVLRQQQDAVLARLGVKGKDVRHVVNPDHVLPPDSQAIWTTALAALYLSALDGVHGIVEDGLGVSFGLPEPMIAEYLSEAGVNIAGIDATTRQAVRDALQEGAVAGENTSQMAARIRALPEFGPARATTIARTELAQATNRAAVRAYQASGKVLGVQVYDGDYDAECAAMNGRRFTLDAAPEPLQHVNCLVGESVVFAANVNATFTRWFDGEVVVIETAAHDLLTCTPNHPILTNKGWVAAGLLKQGDDVIRSLDGERVMRQLDPDNDHRPATIEQIADAFRPAGGRATTTVPGSSEQFHGDGADSDVHVVRAARFSKRGVQSVSAEVGSQHAIQGADVASREFSRLCPAAEVIQGFVSAPYSSVRSSGILCPDARWQSRLADPRDFAAVHGQSFGSQPFEHGTPAYMEALPDSHGAHLLLDVPPLQSLSIRPPVAGISQSAEVSQQACGADAYLGGDAISGLAGLIAPVEILKVERRQFSGHVYNLETAQGWYIAENIITHNCTRSFAPITDAAELEVVA